MTHLAPLLLKFLNLSYDVFALCFSKLLELLDDAELLLLVGFLFVADVGRCSLTCFEEVVASGREALPKVFAVLAWHCANLFPLLLQVDEGIAR